LCERKKRSADAINYNALVQSWPEMLRLAADPASAAASRSQVRQGSLLEADDEE
jgi:hypothetical protein